MLSDLPNKYAGKLLSDELMNDLCRLIATGNFPRTACKLLGINYKKYDEWMRLGSQDGDEDDIYHRFHAQIRQAEAAAEAFAVKKWTAQLDKNYQASRDFLARRFPTRWAEKIEVNMYMRSQLEEIISRLQMSLEPDTFTQVIAALASDQVFAGYMEVEQVVENEDGREVEV
jgi:hypothetical protein